MNNLCVASIMFSVLEKMVLNNIFYLCIYFFIITGEYKADCLCLLVMAPKFFCFCNVLCCLKHIIYNVLCIYALVQFFKCLRKKKIHSDFVEFMSGWNQIIFFLLNYFPTQCGFMHSATFKEQNTCEQRWVTVVMVRF